MDANETKNNLEHFAEDGAKDSLAARLLLQLQNASNDTSMADDEYTLGIILREISTRKLPAAAETNTDGMVASPTREGDPNTSSHQSEAPLHSSPSKSDELHPLPFRPSNESNDVFDDLSKDYTDVASIVDACGDLAQHLASTLDAHADLPCNDDNPINKQIFQGGYPFMSSLNDDSVESIMDRVLTEGSNGADDRFSKDAEIFSTLSIEKDDGETETNHHQTSASLVSWENEQSTNGRCASHSDKGHSAASMAVDLDKFGKPSSVCVDLDSDIPGEVGVDTTYCHQYGELFNSSFDEGCCGHDGSALLTVEKHSNVGFAADKFSPSPVSPGIENKKCTTGPMTHAGRWEARFLELKVSIQYSVVQYRTVQHTHSTVQ